MYLNYYFWSKNKTSGNPVLHLPRQECASISFSAEIFREGKKALSRKKWTRKCFSEQKQAQLLTHFLLTENVGIFWYENRRKPAWQAVIKASEDFFPERRKTCSNVVFVHMYVHSGYVYMGLSATGFCLLQKLVINKLHKFYLHQILTYSLGRYVIKTTK
jgi:hypothetical protein